MPEIDDEHRDLFAMAERLGEAVDSGGDPESVRKQFEALVSHIAGHFAHEEELMRATYYEAYGWHKRQHDVAVTVVMGFKERFEAGDRRAIPGFLRYLSEWINTHTRLTDTMMGAHLRNFVRARAA